MKSHSLPLMILTASLFAQGPGGPRHVMAIANSDQAQSYLNLTGSQLQSLEQIRQSEMTAIRPILQQIAPLRESLQTEMQSGTADAAALGKVMLSIHSLEQQIKTSRDSFHQQALAVLTADQKTKLSALQSAADLMPAMHQAMGLNLLTPPQGGAGEFGIAVAGPEHIFMTRPARRPE